MGKDEPLKESRRSYVPALRFSRLTRYYDGLVALWGDREDRLRGLLIDDIDPRPGQRILDIGSGTGTFVIMLKLAQPDVSVAGLDPDDDIRAIAGKKAAAAGADLTFFRGLAGAPPDDPFFADQSLDCVTSSLVFHHMRGAEKSAALHGAWRMLKPGGRLFIADWGRPHGWAMRLAFLMVQLLDGFETTADSVHDRLKGLIAEAGFSGVEEYRRVRTVLGTLAYYRAEKPGGEIADRGLEKLTIAP